MANRDAALLAAPTLPTGTEVASYRTYMEASGAIDYLNGNDFDVSSLTIVGSDLYVVERVTGRLTTAKVAASGALSGAMWGGFMAAMLSFSSSNISAGIWLPLGLIGGAFIGIIMSVLLYGVTRSKKDFTSQSQVVAARYAVLASSDFDRAFSLLQKTPGNMTRAKTKRTRLRREGATEYGSRPDEAPRFGVRVKTNTGGEKGQSKFESAPPSRVSPESAVRIPLPPEQASGSEPGAAAPTEPSTPPQLSPHSNDNGERKTEPSDGHPDEQ